MITCYAFDMVPPFAQGVVRDVRVRWALEEAGIPYRVRLVGERKGSISRDAYQSVQPFGQVPAIEDGDFRLFESGAIVLWVAERSPELLPKDPARRAHVQQWAFAALNTVEVVVQRLAELDFFHPGESWVDVRRPQVVADVEKRLGELAACLDGREHLAGDFSAADILMTTVLRILRHTDLLKAHPTLAAYVERCESRPAFDRALGDHLAAFAA